MLLLHPETYQETKLVKQVGGALDAPYQDLSDWIFDRYRVRLLNLKHEHVDLTDRFRLHLIWDSIADEAKFSPGGRWNHDPHKEEEIIGAFNALLRRHRQKGRFGTEGLFVICSAFEEGARDEANRRVTAAQKERLCQELGLWTIETFTDDVVFFLDTDKEVKAALAAGTTEAYSQAYGRLLEPYDEFGYLRDNPLQVRIDSYESFQKHYNGNWFHYWK